MLNTTSETTIIRTESEARQIARVMEIDARHAAYIDWNKVATTARQMGAHFEARTAQDGACTVTFFWAYSEAELQDMNWRPA